MNFTVKSFPSDNTELYNISLEIRTIVFIDEQNVDKEIEFDEFEKQCINYLVYDGNIPVATGRWRISEKGIKLERFAVLKEYRGRGAGNVIIKQIMQDVMPLRHKIYLNAQVTAIKFYEKHDFKICSEMFMEADIEHHQMEYQSNLE